MVGSAVLACWVEVQVLAIEPVAPMRVCVGSANSYQVSQSHICRRGYALVAEWISGSLRKTVI